MIGPHPTRLRSRSPQQSGYKGSSMGRGLAIEVSSEFDQDRLLRIWSSDFPFGSLRAGRCMWSDAGNRQGMSMAGVSVKCVSVRRLELLQALPNLTSARQASRQEKDRYVQDGTFVPTPGILGSWQTLVRVESIDAPPTPTARRGMPPIRCTTSSPVRRRGRSRPTRSSGPTAR